MRGRGGGEGGLGWGLAGAGAGRRADVVGRASGWAKAGLLGGEGCRGRDGFPTGFWERPEGVGPEGAGRAGKGAGSTGSGWAVGAF